MRHTNSVVMITRSGSGSNRHVFLFFNICIIFFGLIFSGRAFAEAISSEEGFNKEKEIMLESLVSDYGISDKKVLQAIAEVDRSKFVPEEFQSQAYEDTRIAIGHGYEQRISLARTVAQTLELLKLRGGEKILEIGTGSGYQTAVMAKLAKEVYTIEIDEELAKKAEARFRELGYSNIKVKCGDGFLGWEEFVPYDIIIVSALLDTDVPPVLIQQVIEGGRIVIPVLTGAREEEVKLMIEKKVNGRVIEEWVGYNDR